MTQAEFDPLAKERELQTESASWDTSSPVPAEPGDIATIDVTKWLATHDQAELDIVARQLREASEDTGFHQLVGHGVPQGDVDAIFAAAKQFHALPLAVKETILMDRPGVPIGGMGYLPVGERKLPRRDKGNVNEAFLIKGDRHIGFDDNQWLPEAVAPGFRAAVERYAGVIANLALRMLPVWAAALELPPTFFDSAFTHPFWRLRLTRYPPAERVSPDDAFGIAPHVDTTFFTLLLQDGPGLTIFSHRRQQWISVPVVPGAFVVNSGELLRQWSNDRVLSTRHFANNTVVEGAASTDRYSIPFFFNANADYPMECLPTCQGPDNPPRYPTISYLESQAVAQGE